ncbi:MAG: hypothetical protein Q9197_006795 [Variospora fuerteventurae]
MADEKKPPEPDNADLTVMFKKRHVVRKGNKRIIKSDDDSSGESDPGTQAPRGVKRNKPNIPGTATSLTNTKASSSDPEAAFTKSTDVQVGKSYIDDATKQSHWFDGQSSQDHNALGRGLWETSGKALSMNKESAKMERQPKAKIFGPAKAAPANVRITTMFDYAPDVCKDYKQTGYCGFGDNCKYLHDRSDYLQGWQLDREWEKASQREKGRGGIVKTHDRGVTRGEEGDMRPTDVPFVCIICREAYKNPIVTQCRHYFCEKCALERYNREPGCAACGAATNGVFNAAGKLKKLLEKKKAGDGANG